jgi:hypothetical protein
MSGRDDNYDPTAFFGYAMPPGPLYAPTTAQTSAYQKAIAERVHEDAAGGKKFDSGKLDYTLLPIKALEDTVKVLGFGAVKYGRGNWQTVERRRYIAAAFRHLMEIAKDNELDEESGETHAAHLTCCALFLGARS